jgi:transcription elongation GreA/GreB family factor
VAGLAKKQALKEELIALLTHELDVLSRAHKAAREAATHEEAKPENDKDTRALEQSYLAHGQAKRVEELTAGLAEVHRMALRAFGEASPIALGALVESEEDGESRAFFVAPHGGGTALGSGTVQVITPQSPLGRALIGKRLGDDCEITIAGKVRQLELLKVE